MKAVRSSDDILEFYWLEVQSQYPPKKAREIKSQTETAIHCYTIFQKQ